MTDNAPLDSTLPLSTNHDPLLASNLLPTRNNLPFPSLNREIVLQDHANISAEASPVAIYLASLTTDDGRRTMRAALDRIAQLLHSTDEATHSTIAWHQLRFQHTQAIRSILVGATSSRTGQRYKPATINKMLAALRGVLKAAWLLDLMSAEQYQRAVLVKAVNGNSLPAGRNVPSAELGALLNSCNDDPLGVRDAAILSVLYACGLRRAEITALDRKDIKEDSLIVHGKRGKVRTVPIGAAFYALDEWRQTRGDAEGALFWGLGNRNRGKRLTTQAIYDMLRRRAKVAGVINLSPHDLRRSFVGDLLDAGADIATVQQMAGHASVNTTARYDRRGERAKQKAASLLHVPQRQRNKK
ncbi:MAG: tyrosine-type recombinase/integrase [Candidatus Promineifilaceae bacterium]